MTALSVNAVSRLRGMALLICCAVRFAVTSAWEVQSLSLSEPLNRGKVKQARKQSHFAHKQINHIPSLVFHDQDSPAHDNVLDVRPGRAGSRLREARKLVGGESQAAEETPPNDKVDIMEKVECRNTPEVCLRFKPVVGLYPDGVDTDT
jgi:hypothetical protein